MPWRKKIARIDCTFRVGQSRGTGFLVAKDRVLTAHHVIEPQDVTGPRTSIRLSFLDDRQQPAVVRTATPVAGAFEADPSRDWILLALDQPVTEEPFQLAPLRDDIPKQGWYSYGFPADAAIAGISLTGEVMASGAVHELSCTEVAFTQRGAEGASGAPCIVGERVVGLIQSSLDRGAAGRLFATSSAELAAHASLRPYFRPPPTLLNKVDELLRRSARLDYREPPIDKVRAIARTLGVPTLQITSEDELRRALAWRILDGGYDTFLDCLNNLIDAGLIARPHASSRRTTWSRSGWTRRR